MPTVYRSLVSAISANLLCLLALSLTSQAGATSQDQVYLRITTLALIERANGNKNFRGYVYFLELVEVI